MVPNLIGFLFILLVLIAISRFSMPFGGAVTGAGVGRAGVDSASVESASVEAFSFPVPGHQNYIDESLKKLNPLTNLINVTDPVLSLQEVNTRNMYDAVRGTEAVPDKIGGYELKEDAKYEIPESVPSSFRQAIGCQNAPKTCAAFDDATFASQCGMSFDQEGVGSDGKPHIGGHYVAPDDREIQTAYAKKIREKRIPPYDPYKAYQPSLGIAKPGTFSLTKDQCIIVKEKVDCEAKQSFSTPNCTQCYTSQRFARVGSDTPQIPSTIYLQGQGRISVSSPDNSIQLDAKRLETNGTIQVSIPAGSEGKTFLLQVDADERIPTYVSGYLEGETGRGTFKIDLMTLIQSDLVTQAKPRMMGTKKVNAFRSMSFVPGAKQKQMRLSCMMPFSFLNMYESDAITCDNGPIVTKESSATFLESDPCYGKANSAGNYKLECLQSRWIALGGSVDGTGYPSTPEKGKALQMVNGKGLSLDDIMDQLSTKMTRAITGKQENGSPLSIPEWNEVSMWGLGIPIQTPCDGLQKETGPLSRECLSYLYENRGAASRVGSTYTMPASKVASGKGANGVVEGWEDVTATNAVTYSYPNAPLDPATSSGLAAGQALGGVEAVKERYDAIHRRANDNTKTNTDRALDVSQAYGITLPAPSSSKVSGPVQVFAVGPDYRYTKEEAPGICAKYGAKVATTAQLEEAQKAGADWCFSGWVTEGVGKWPITTSPVQGCGGRQGVIEWTPGSKAGVNCYGPKPQPNDVAPGTVFPFNGDLWDKPTEPTYVTVKSGYLESSGPQPSCFSGLSPDEAKKGCDRLGSQCVGFSYSKDGAGHGCYKVNHAAGLNTNDAYMGYVKIPTGGKAEPVVGRYIRLDYTRQDCLNLAQILVFSSEGGPNIITQQTKVTKSSGYTGDVSPSQNFVNQMGAVFGNNVHTSCNDVPWIEVDLGSTITIYKIVVWNRTDCCQERILGTVLSVLNEEREKIYISNPIRTTNQSYTWNPPNGDVFVDKDPIPMPPTQKVYGNNGSTSCDQYCRGTGGRSWNNELPHEWNGAKCADVSPGISNCHSGFSYNSSTYCVCEKTGWGWDTRGWRGP